MRWLAAALVLCLTLGIARAAEDAPAPSPQGGAEAAPEPDFSQILAAAKAASPSALMPGLGYRSFQLLAFGITVNAWTFDQAPFRMHMAEQKSPKGSLVADMIGDGLFAINGGFFERDKQRVLSPSGLLIINGKQVAPENDRGGSGVIYAGPAGLGIGYRKSLTAHPAMRDAVQVGPILVDPGGKVGVLNKQHKRDNRSAVCLTQGAFTVVVVQGGLSLFQLASLLAAPSAAGGFGCEIAINLDGGPSTQAALRVPGHRMDISGAAVENALIVSPTSN